MKFPILGGCTLMEYSVMLLTRLHVTYPQRDGRLIRTALFLVIPVW